MSDRQRVLEVLPGTVFLSLAMTILLAISGPGCGDKPEHFRAAGIGLAVGVVASLLVAARARAPRAVRQVRHVTRTGVRHFLVYIFVIYGLAKILDIQFTMSLIDLDRRLVEMRPMGVAWAFFGYTYTYQAFTGLAELAGALLLAWRRTATVGALILLGVVSNIVVMNLAYQVCVRLNAAIYLAMLLYLLAPDANRLLRFAIGRAVPERHFAPVFRGVRAAAWWRRVTAISLTAALVVPFWETHRDTKAYRLDETPPIRGVWEIERVLRGSGGARVEIAPEDLAGRPWRKLIIEAYPIGALRGPETSDFFRFELDEAARTLAIEIRDPAWRFEGRYTVEADAEAPRLILEGRVGEAEVTLETRRLVTYDKKRR